MNRYAAQQPSNTSKMASNVMSGAKDMASKVGAGAKDMATQAGGAAKDFAGRMADKVGDAVQSRRMAGVNKQLADTVARKFGSGATTNQLAAQGYNQAAKQAGKQALKQGAKRLAAMAGPAAAVAGAGMTGYEIGDKLVNPAIDEYTSKTNKYGEKSNAVERGIGKIASMLPESMGGISEKQYQDMYGDAPAKKAPNKQVTQGAIDTVNKFTGGQNKKAPNMSMENPSKAMSKEKQTQAQFNRPAMEEQVKAGNEPNKFVFDKDTKFKDAFNEARAGGADEFEWGGKKYHTFHQKELDDKGNTRAAKYRPKAKEVPVQGKTFKDNITGKTRQAPPPGISEDASTSVPVQRPSRQAQKPMNMKDFGRTNYREDITGVERMKAARGEMPASRPSTKEIRGLKNEAYNRMNNRVKASRDYQAAKEANNVKAMKNAKAMFESNKPNDKAYNKMKSRIEDNRFQSNRFTDYRPSRKETEAMTRSEDSSIEKLKKHMGKQKTSKKEGE